MLPIRIYRVIDRSMEPGLREGDYVFVSMVRIHLREGDLVVARHPRTGLRIIKRVESIGDGRAFLVGDNRAASEDSRSFGSVGLSDIIGKVIYTVR
jgi:nickel-type superoxide dismutase maturation protease